MKYAAAHIALNRFGYSARGDEYSQAKNNPQQWVLDQLNPITPAPSELSSSNIFTLAQQAKQADSEQQINLKKSFRELAISGLKDAIEQHNSVSWKLLDFFSNHFSVTASGKLLSALAPTLEREAIAPNLLGKFKDMLMAVIKHPAMLIYLNNDRSTGPNSRLGKRRGLGMNENLAREILELHTLGVNGGYDQQDVEALAKAITGWHVQRNASKGDPGYVFRTNAHEPGSKSLLGKSYSQQGEAQGEAMLNDLANHPSTRAFVCRKLANFFVSEAPSALLLSTMEKAWQDSDGSIESVMRAMIEHADAWQTSANRYKNAREFLISAVRVLAPAKLKPNQLFNSAKTLGQQPFKAGSPAGYGDSDADWLGSGAIMNRADWSNLAVKLSSVTTDEFIEKCFGDALSDETMTAVARAESQQQGLVILLMSPEFQRR